MKNKILILILLTGLCGCGNPTQLTLFDSFKPADNFSRTFVNNLMVGNLDSCFAAVDAEKLTDTAKLFIARVNRGLNGGKLKGYKIVDESGSMGVWNNKQFANYRLGYEYEFDRGYVLFITTVSEKNSKLSIVSFTAQPLRAPLAELTKFSFTGKSVIQYIFVALAVLAPLFMVITLVMMLLSRATAKKKVLWTVIILVISSPRFLIDWNTGQIDFHLFMFGIPGAGVTRSSLYSAWTLYFSLPLGSIIYWTKRKSLLQQPVLDGPEDTSDIIEDEVGGETLESEGIS